jgi:hypothetical protein
MDPYEVLGVNKSASKDEIKQSYHELVRRYHPDQFRDNPLSHLAEEKLKEINEAYDILTNNEIRYEHIYYTSTQDGYQGNEDNKSPSKTDNIVVAVLTSFLKICLKVICSILLGILNIATFILLLVSNVVIWIAGLISTIMLFSMILEFIDNGVKVGTDFWFYLLIIAMACSLPIILQGLIFLLTLSKDKISTFIWEG